MRRSLFSIATALAFSLASGVAQAQVARSTLPTWKVVKLGTFNNTADLRQALADGKFRFGQTEEEVLQRTPLAKREQAIELVKVTVESLGFSMGATTAQIIARAQERGLDLVPAEVGPQLRLQYVDQTGDEVVGIGMSSIIGTDGREYVYHVDLGPKGRALYAIDNHPAGWAPFREWTFSRK